MTAGEAMQPASSVFSASSSNRSGLAAVTTVVPSSSHHQSRPPYSTGEAEWRPVRRYCQAILPVASSTQLNTPVSLTR